MHHDQILEKSHFSDYVSRNPQAKSIGTNSNQHLHYAVNKKCFEFAHVISGANLVVFDYVVTLYNWPWFVS